MTDRPLFDSPPAVRQTNAKLGTLLQAMPKRSGADSHGGGSSGSKRELLPDAPPTLAELGIDRKPRPGSKTPVLPARAKTPPEVWRIELSGHNRDNLPPVVCRIRRVLKNAGRCYQLRAKILAGPPPAATPGESTACQSSASPAGQQTAFNEAAGTVNHE